MLAMYCNILSQIIVLLSSYYRRNILALFRRQCIVTVQSGYFETTTLALVSVAGKEIELEIVLLK